jgi:hypothetical protein
VADRIPVIAGEVARRIGARLPDLTPEMTTMFIDIISEFRHDQAVQRLMVASTASNIGAVVDMLILGISLEDIAVPPAAAEYASRFAQHDLSLEACHAPTGWANTRSCSGSSRTSTTSTKPNVSAGRKPACSSTAATPCVCGSELARKDESMARLRETLQVLLEANGSYTEAAARMHVHKNTVLHRVRKAEELLSRPVTDGRLAIEVALLAWDQLAVTTQEPVPQTKRVDQPARPDV